MKRENSNLYKSEIHQIIPGGAHTYSKGDDEFSENAPAAISHGKGAYVWDVDRNKFLDCSMGLSSVSLGHAHKPLIEVVKKEIVLSKVIFHDFDNEFSIFTYAKKYHQNYK